MVRTGSKLLILLDLGFSGDSDFGRIIVSHSVGLVFSHRLNSYFLPGISLLCHVHTSSLDGFSGCFPMDVF